MKKILFAACISIAATSIVTKASAQGVGGFLFGSPDLQWGMDGQSASLDCNSDPTSCGTYWYNFQTGKYNLTVTGMPGIVFEIQRLAGTEGSVNPGTPPASAPPVLHNADATLKRISK